MHTGRVGLEERIVRDGCGPLVDTETSGPGAGSVAGPARQEDVFGGNHMIDVTARAMVHARRLELDRHPTPPAGDEVHTDGIYYQAQQGDGLTAIAREHSNAYHMDLSVTQLQASNQRALADGLQADELLIIPNLVPRTDTFFLGAHPRLTEQAGQLRHVIGEGQTLTSIARHYATTDGLALTAANIHDANRDILGPNPDVIPAGAGIRIPGITTRSPEVSMQSLSDLDQDVVASRVKRVQHRNGSVEEVTVSKGVAVGSHAVHAGFSRDAAVREARASVADGSVHGASDVSVNQTRDGAYWIVPLRWEPVEELASGDRVLSSATRSDDRSLIATADAAAPGVVNLRRYDR